MLCLEPYYPFQGPGHDMTKCVCRSHGWCDRHNCAKTPHFHYLCQTSEPYFDAWERGRGPRQKTGLDDRLSRPVEQKGPGTELRKIIASRRFNLLKSVISFWETPPAATKVIRRCGCGDKAKKMDTWGPAECRQRRLEIILWILDSAMAASPRVKRMSQIRLANAIMTWTIGRIVDRAINRCD